LFGRERHERRKSDADRIVELGLVGLESGMAAGEFHRTPPVRAVFPGWGLAGMLCC
jgi:hypothetical protein